MAPCFEKNGPCFQKIKPPEAPAHRRQGFHVKKGLCFEKIKPPEAPAHRRQGFQEIPAPVLISENLPRRAGFPLTPGRRLRARVLNIGEIPAPVLISENLPRRAGFPSTPGRPAKRFDWTPAASRPQY